METINKIKEGDCIGYYNQCFFIVLGHAEVAIHRGYSEGDLEKRENSILFTKKIWKKALVGELLKDSPFLGKPEYDLPKPYCKITFDNLEGLDALLAELNVLRKSFVREPED